MIRIDQVGEVVRLTNNGEVIRTAVHEMGMEFVKIMAAILSELAAGKLVECNSEIVCKHLRAFAVNMIRVFAVTETTPARIACTE